MIQVEGLYNYAHACFHRVHLTAVYLVMFTITANSEACHYKWPWRMHMKLIYEKVNQQAQ